MDDTRGFERRRHARVLSLLAVVLTQRPAGDQVALQAEGDVLDISEGGLFAVVRGEPEAGLPIEIELQLEQEAVRMQGRLIRAMRYGRGWFGVALEFEQPERDSLGRIAGYVDAVLRDRERMAWQATPEVDLLESSSGPAPEADAH